MDKDNKNKYLGAELVLEKLRLLDNLLETKLTDEQVNVLVEWCKTNNVEIGE